MGKDLEEDIGILRKKSHACDIDPDPRGGTLERMFGSLTPRKRELVDGVNGKEKGS